MIVPSLNYLSDDLVLDRAWKSSRYFELPTLYDAAFMAVSEVVMREADELCEFWTADEKLINTMGGRRTT